MAVGVYQIVMNIGTGRSCGKGLAGLAVRDWPQDQLLLILSNSYMLYYSAHTAHMLTKNQTVLLEQPFLLDVAKHFVAHAFSYLAICYNCAGIIGRCFLLYLSITRSQKSLRSTV